MQNLHLTNLKSVDCTGYLQPEARVCVDAANGITYITNNETNCQITEEKDTEENKCAWQLGKQYSMKYIQRFVKSTHDIISCDVVNTNLFITYGCGHIVLITPEDQCYDMGMLDDGIKCCAWSPDEEVLAVVTKKNDVRLLGGFDEPYCDSNSDLPICESEESALFCPLAHFSLNDENFGQSAFVNVGWGKKETQFHGSEGKQAAQAIPQNRPSGLTSYDDGKPRLSWRGDGQMFAVSYIDTEKNRRMLRVADRSGALLSTGEDVAMLEAPLFWKPDGSVITSCQRVANKYNVIFFEKNGLRHGEFTLPERKGCFAREVLWNSDSSVLMVWFSPTSLSDNDGDNKEVPIDNFVQLWTVSNYTWFLKEELAFEDVQQVLWNPLDAMRLIVVQKNFVIHLHFAFVIDSALCNSAADAGLVSVVNGPRLLMTPFKQSKVPPPMCAYEMYFDSQINGIAFAPSQRDTSGPEWLGRSCVCVLHGTTLSILSPVFDHEECDSPGCKVDFRLNRSHKFSVKFSRLKVETQFTISSFSSNCRLSNLAWTKDNFLVGTKHLLHGGEEGFFTMDLSKGSDSLNTFGHDSHSLLVGCVCLDQVYFQDWYGKLYYYGLNEKSLVRAKDTDHRQMQFPSTCVQMAACNIDDVHVVFGLTSRGRLYAIMTQGFQQSAQLCNNCTSFFIYDDFLLVTTTSHKLLMLPLKIKTIQSALLEPGDDGVHAGERTVERGSKLVTAITESCEVVLQMPRGNIEVIYPRPLLVHSLKKLLDSQEYHRVIEIMRKHRIDMNLIYDHNPQDFMGNCRNFVRSVNNAGWLDLFLASLKNVDTTTTLYKFNYKDSPPPQLENEYQTSKVDHICTVLRETMLSVDKKSFLLPILTSYVKMDSSQMDEALRMVKSLREDDSFGVSCEEGLKHLLYIANADLLCDVALSTFDFDLVMMVFEKSQKDPKEFLPFLNRLKKMEDNYMKYVINVYLKRYRTAFPFLRNTDSLHVQECLELIKREKLYSEALEGVRGNDALFNAVLEAYADYNLDRCQYLEAALLYERAKLYPQALNTFLQIGNWRKAFLSASRLSYSNEQMFELYHSTVESLKDKRQYADAAKIYMDYLHNEEEAVSCFSLAGLWNDAVGLSYQYTREDLIETIVIPELLEQYSSFETEISTLSKTFSESFNRLLVVRELKEKELTDAMDCADEGKMDTDMYCDTSTVTGRTASSRSASSGRTHRSAKNRKKMERKKHSTKEGSAYEDLGLVTQLHSLITRADELANPLSCLVSAMFSLEKDNEAANLQDSLNLLYRLIESKQKCIWPSGESEESVEFKPASQMSTEELVKSRLAGNGGQSGNSTQRTILRMQQLEPALRFPPKVTRSSNWAFGFLQKNKKPIKSS